MPLTGCAESLRRSCHAVLSSRAICWFLTQKERPQLVAWQRPLLPAAEGVWFGSVNSILFAFADNVGQVADGAIEFLTVPRAELSADADNVDKDQRASLCGELLRLAFTRALGPRSAGAFFTLCPPTQKKRDRCLSLGNGLSYAQLSQRSCSAGVTSFAPDTAFKFFNAIKFFLRSWSGTQRRRRRPHSRK